MPIVIEKLEEDVQLPFDEVALRSEDPQKLVEYILVLVKSLQEILGQITVVANYGVDLNDGDALYFGLKDSTGVYPIGMFRWIQVDNTAQLQEKVTNTGVSADDWVKVARHSR